MSKAEVMEKIRRLVEAIPADNTRMADLGEVFGRDCIRYYRGPPSYLNSNLDYFNLISRQVDNTTPIIPDNTPLFEDFDLQDFK